MDSKGYIREYFKKRVTLFPDFYQKRPLLPIEAYIVEQIPATGSVLDLCCGGGEVSISLAKRGTTVTGVDNVAEMCVLCDKLFAEEKYTGVFHVADSTELPFPDHSFTHVVCTGNSLNSMTNEDARLTIREAARVAIPGGWLYLTILNPTALRNVLATVRGALQGAPPWGFYYKSSYGLQPNSREIPRGMSFLVTMPKMRKYLQEAGLKYKVTHWDIGLQASHLLLTCRKEIK